MRAIPSKTELKYIAKMYKSHNLRNLLTIEVLVQHYGAPSHFDVFCVENVLRQTFSHAYDWQKVNSGVPEQNSNFPK